MTVYDSNYNRFLSIITIKVIKTKKKLKYTIDIFKEGKTENEGNCGWRRCSRNDGSHRSR